MSTHDRGRRHGLALIAAALGLPACSVAPARNHAGPDAPRAEALPAPIDIAWVLSSGGPRGFVHVGVLRALAELDLVPDLIVGTSAGALAGGLHASGMDPMTLQSLALGIQPWSMARLTWPGEGWFSGAPLAEWMRSHAGVGLLEDLPVRLACVALRRRDRVPVAFTAGDIGLSVQAATAIEGRLTPVHIRGEPYVDADWVVPLPVRIARELGARHVLAVDATAHLDRVPASAEEYRESDARKAALVEVDARAADFVLKPDFGYWAGSSQAYRLRVIEAGYHQTLAQADALRRLHRR